VPLDIDPPAGLEAVPPGLPPGQPGGIDFESTPEAEIEAAVVRLGSSGKAALPVLTNLLASPDPERRWWAVRALAEVPAAVADTEAGLQNGPVSADWAAQLLAQALGDSDPGVCQCAALALSRRVSPAGVPALVECLSSPDGLLRRLAGDALAAVGAPAVHALIAALETGPDTGRGQAARALALIADPRSIPALFAVLDDRSTFVIYWAEQGLDKMGVGMQFFDPSG